MGIQLTKVLIRDYKSIDSLLIHIDGKSFKAVKELGWQRTMMFKDGIKLTIQWYKDHMDCMAECTSGEYQKYYQEMYGKR